MFNINSWEILVLAALFVVLFGPDRLPQVMGQVVKLLRDLQRLSDSATAELRQELEAVTQAADLTKPLPPGKRSTARVSPVEDPGARTSPSADEPDDASEDGSEDAAPNVPHGESATGVNEPGPEAPAHGPADEPDDESEDESEDAAPSDPHGESATGVNEPGPEAPGWSVADRSPMAPSRSIFLHPQDPDAPNDTNAEPRQ